MPAAISQPLVLGPEDALLKNSHNETVSRNRSGNWLIVLDASKEDALTQQDTFLQDIGRRDLYINGLKTNVDNGEAKLKEIFMAQGFSLRDFESVKQHYNQHLADCFWAQALTCTTPSQAIRIDTQRLHFFKKDGKIYLESLIADIYSKELQDGKVEVRIDLPGKIKSTCELTENGFQLKQVEFSNTVLRDFCLSDIPMKITSGVMEEAKDLEEQAWQKKSLQFTERLQERSEILSLDLDDTTFKNSNSLPNPFQLTPELLTLAYWYQSQGLPVVINTHRCIEQSFQAFTLGWAAGKNNLEQFTFHYPYELLLQNQIQVTPITALDPASPKYYEQLVEYEKKVVDELKDKEIIEDEHRPTYQSELVEVQGELKIKNNDKGNEYKKPAFMMMPPLANTSQVHIYHVDDSAEVNAGIAHDSELKDPGGITVTPLRVTKEKNTFQTAQKTIAENSLLHDAAQRLLLTQKWSGNLLQDLATIRYLLEQNNSSTKLPELIKNFMDEKFDKLNSAQQQAFLLTYFYHLPAEDLNVDATPKIISKLLTQCDSQMLPDLKQHITKTLNEYISQYKIDRTQLELKNEDEPASSNQTEVANETRIDVTKLAANARAAESEGASPNRPLANKIALGTGYAVGISAMVLGALVLAGSIATLPIGFGALGLPIGLSLIAGGLAICGATGFAHLLLNRSHAQVVDDIESQPTTKTVSQGTKKLDLTVRPGGLQETIQNDAIPPISILNPPPSMIVENAKKVANKPQPSAQLLNKFGLMAQEKGMPMSENHKQSNPLKKEKEPAMSASPSNKLNP